MFRVTQFMQEIASPTPIGPKRNPPGPVVIWNLIRRCNLACKHCYSVSADRDFPGELTTEEVFAVMDDLKRFRVPVLILSGGEPLLRPDIFDIARRAKAMGFYVGLSTNGTLIDTANVGDIAEIGFDYVGISLDGRRETHDRFRRKAGAFDDSLRALRLLPRRRRQGRRALHADAATTSPTCRGCSPERARGHRQVLSLAPELRRPRQHQPQGRRAARHDAGGDGPALRRLLGQREPRRSQGVRHRQQRRRRRLSAVLGAPALSRSARRTSARSSSSGAATPRA